MDQSQMLTDEVMSSDAMKSMMNARMRMYEDEKDQEAKVDPELTLFIDNDDPLCAHMLAYLDSHGATHRFELIAINGLSRKPLPGWLIDTPTCVDAEGNHQTGVDCAWRVRRIVQGGAERRRQGPRRVSARGESAGYGRATRVKQCRDMVIDDAEAEAEAQRLYERSQGAIDQPSHATRVSTRELSIVDVLPLLMSSDGDMSILDSRTV